MSDLVERLRDWASNSTGCNPANAPCAEAADEIERLRGRLAEVERAAGVACNGCGHTETIEQIRAKHPNAISCCPERDMVPAVTWMKRADTATARAERLAAALKRGVSLFEGIQRAGWVTKPAFSDEINLHLDVAHAALSDSPTVELPPGWLKTELHDAAKDAAAWSQGIKDSFKEATWIDVAHVAAFAPNKGARDE